MKQNTAIRLSKEVILELDKIVEDIRKKNLFSEITDKSKLIRHWIIENIKNYGKSL